MSTSRCSKRTRRSATASCTPSSKPESPSVEPFPASTASATRRSGTSSNSRIRTRWPSCAASSKPLTRKESSIRACSSTDEVTMNGAQALIRTLVDGGVDVCFANPGTSEMHFVAALDAVPEMRAALGLFEGVVTGAADGYGRMADRPAATLLHLGPGMANGLANLHNARRAHTPVVNVIGDHARYHKGFDAPLESDIDALTGWLGGWSRTSKSTEEVGTDAAAAIAAAMQPPGQLANLVLPADVSWSDGGEVGDQVEPVAAQPVEDDRVKDIAAIVRGGEPVVVLLGHGTTRERGLLAASRIAAATGVKLFAETFPARIERGAGLPNIERLGYLAEQVQWQLTDVKHLVLVGAKSPVSFF